MADPTQEEYFTDWVKPFPRDVTEFGIISSDLKTVTYNIPFHLYGIKFFINAGSYEYWDGHQNASNDIKPITHTFSFIVKMTFEDNTVYHKEFSFSSYGQDVPHKSFVKTGKKIKRIEISKDFRQKTIREVYGGYNMRMELVDDGYGKGHYKNVKEKWYYTVTKTLFAEIKDFRLYEHPCIDSGMRIAGANGKIYTPAETAFPSPLRIFHKRVRNIMLVPLNCDYASIFKIKTKEGIQAITTLS
ncbi:MAG: hypothetical protein ACTTI3_08905 [Treponema sp.]